MDLFRGSLTETATFKCSKLFLSKTLFLANTSVAAEVERRGYRSNLFPLIMKLLPKIEPMQLSAVPEPFDHEDWIFELKHDGFTAVV